MSDLDLSVGAAGAPIDTLAPVRLGRYEDGLVVVVERAVGGRPARLAGGVRTAHFDVMVDDRRLRVVHDLDPARVDNDVGDLVAGELVRPGWVNGSDAFEHIFTGLVLTSHPDPQAAWDSFYRNTLARLDALLESPTLSTAPRGTSRSPPSRRCTRTPNCWCAATPCWSSAAASGSPRFTWPLGDCRSPPPTSHPARFGCCG